MYGVKSHYAKFESLRLNMTALLLHIKQFITPSEHQLQNLKSLLLVDTIDKHFAMCCIFKFHLKVVSLPYFFFDEKCFKTMEEIHTVLT